jgi:hypothetical protein
VAGISGFLRRERLIKYVAPEAIRFLFILFFELHRDII